MAHEQTQIFCRYLQLPIIFLLYLNFYFVINMSSSVLVIGATGYIGEGIAKAFRRFGYKVYGVTRDEKKKDQLLRNEIIPVIS